MVDPVLMHWWCTDDALMMHWWCTDDALMMLWWCTVDALIMHWSCTDDALMMHCWCTDDVLKMHWRCTDHALIMHWGCSYGVLMMHWWCSDDNLVGNLFKELRRVEKHQEKQKTLKTLPRTTQNGQKNMAWNHRMMTTLGTIWGPTVSWQLGTFVDPSGPFGPTLNSMELIWANLENNLTQRIGTQNMLIHLLTDFSAREYHSWIGEPLISFTK